MARGQTSRQTTGDKAPRGASPKKRAGAKKPVGKVKKVVRKALILAKKEAQYSEDEEEDLPAVEADDSLPKEVNGLRVRTREEGTPLLSVHTSMGVLICDG